MGDIRNLIEKKTAEAQAQQEQNRKERENLSEVRSSALVTITGSPEMYQMYLDLQGSNLRCSVGNIALALIQNPDAKHVGDRNYWHDLGRFVKDEEMKNSIRVFIPPRNHQARGYFMGDYYDVEQTTGKPVKNRVRLDEGGEKLETALAALMETSPVTFKEDTELEMAAYYDPEDMVIYINPDSPDTAIFAELAGEIAHAKSHGRGRNENYERQEFSLDAESAAYLLCKHFGVECQKPNASRVAQFYEGYEAADRESVLNEIKNVASDMSRRIENAIQPRGQEQKRGKSNRAAR